MMPRATTGRFSLVLVTLTCVALTAFPATAQPTGGSALATSDPPHQREQMTMAPSGGWQVMGDGVFWAMVNRQGGPRGGTEAKAPNWWMGMLAHPLAGGRLTLDGMLSLEPATVGKCGYAEIFQVGETCNGTALVDRQHPHDLTMQLAGTWRVPIGRDIGVTFAGGPVGEPALGPVAFMHRPSAGENPVAPLSHHTFDSTHISMGVVTAAVDRGPVVVEASIFNGREPDENRWNLMDPGPLDSWAARFWVRPAAGWLAQVSSGVLKDPEALEPGNVRRTTASVEWLRQREAGYTAATAGFGRNDKAHDALNAVFVEATHRSRANAVHTRLEILQTETDLLISGGVPAASDAAMPVATVVAWTVGGVRDLWRHRGAEVGVGGDLTFYGVPQALQATHGQHPVSFHLFVRVRPPSAMGRMWDMTMTHLVERREKAMVMPMMQGPMAP